MKYKNFEDFLSNKHADQCEGVLDDDMPDDLERWVCNLDGQEMQDFAEEWGQLEYIRGKDEMLALEASRLVAEKN
jgi:hypothetical protein